MLKRYLQEGRLEAGCDEAGRGCLAGPVYAAAVILDPSNPIEGLNDSKKLSLKRRNILREQIEHKALCWAVGVCDEKEIDEINILNASFLAMNKAVNSLNLTPEHLLIDGNRFKTSQAIPYTCVIKGDAKYQSIAAASILAKTHRDEYMQVLARSHPKYHFDKHKGYATQLHRKAIEKYGYIECHRKSFKLKNLQLELFNES